MKLYFKIRQFRKDLEQFTKVYGQFIVVLIATLTFGVFIGKFFF